MNDNQNDFVTRSTSRVLSEPGGKSSTGFLFGGGASANATNKPKGCTDNEVAAAKASAVDGAAASEKLAEKVVAGETPEPESTVAEVGNGATSGEESAIAAASRIKKKNEGQSFSLFGGASSSNGNGGGAEEKSAPSSNAFASASTTNSYNVLTDRPTSRVLRPPGGHSSIKLG